MKVNNFSQNTQLIIFVILSTLASVTMATQGADKIEAGLKSKLEKGEKANIMVSFASTAPVLEGIQYPDNISRGDRSTLVQKTLEEHMNRCQGGVVKLLKERNVQFSQFWINNGICVKDADKATAMAIAADPEVVAVKEEQVAQLMGNAS